MISIHDILEFSWFFLFAMALLFLGLELRCKFDKAFLYHGAALLLLCAFTAVDLWILPEAGLESSLFFIRLQHLTFLFFSCFTLANVLNLLGQKRPILIKAVYLSSLVLSVFTFTPLVWKIENQQIEPGVLYLPLYGTFLPSIVIGLIYFILSGVSYVEASERRILRTHLVGLSLLAGFGLLDFIFAIFPDMKFIASTTQIGTFIYGLTVSSIFMDRFLQVLRDKASAFNKLESAYRELENANNLREIGESTAIVNHEIKNYMFMISGNAQILREMEPLTLKGQELVNNIITSVDRMSQFSRDILEMSKTQILIEKHPINVLSLIEGVIHDHFSDHAKFIEVDGKPESSILQADWGRFEQILVNLIKNALEATPKDELPEIQIRLRSNESVFLISIEDHGVGCNDEQCENLFKAFYTTKKGNGGTGLGLSIVRSIVESHGGRITAYSKNSQQPKSHGIRVLMSFPNFNSTEHEFESHAKIIVLRQNMPEIGSAMQIMKNVCITPTLLDDVAHLNLFDSGSRNKLIFVSTKTYSEQYDQLKRFRNVVVLSQQGKSIYALDPSNGLPPVVFCEEYLFETLMGLKKPRQSKRLMEGRPAPVSDVK